MGLLPEQPEKLTRWFAEGVQKEIDALNKDGGYQKYELISGRLIRVITPFQAIYQFIITDGNRIPEDSVGRIKIDSAEYEAKICSQQLDSIQLQVNFDTTFMPNIPRAILLIDDTQLLQSLLNELEKRIGDSYNDSKALTVFYPHLASISSIPLPENEDFDEITDEQRKTMEQALGSDITYIWGPPGTGKTFVIAHLIMAYVMTGQRVLVTSHTNAAVDQILLAMFKYSGNLKKPAFNKQFSQEESIIRIGLVPETNNIPDHVKLDKVVEKRSVSLQHKIDNLKIASKELSQKLESLKIEMSEWEELSSRTKEFEDLFKSIEVIENKIQDLNKLISKKNLYLEKCQKQLEKALNALFKNADKISEISILLEKAEDDLNIEKARFVDLNQRKLELKNVLDTAQLRINSQRIVCDRLPSHEYLSKEITSITDQIMRLTGEIQAIQLEIDQIQMKVISNATIIFATLTKNYTGRELETEKFDVVIIDEISMALPPTILLVAHKAQKKVVLVGDFLQLPPVVRGTNKETNPQLNIDVFHLAGVARDMKAVPNCPVLARLSVQRRMLPQISKVAYNLAYRKAGLRLKDDKEYLTVRSTPDWIQRISEKPLIIVDTAEMHCWCGKQPQTLSRFNFYTANIAIELARRFISSLEPPNDNETLPIGIVTPYAAQRRILSQLLIEAKLEPWVKAGTVHTFQGGEAELIIFDSVLDEPYWSARLCNPRDANEVIRDLNVAVTRARHRFLFLGSSIWMNRHANINSGLGEFWSLLLQKNDPVPIGKFFESNQVQPELNFGLNTIGWNNTDGDEEYTFELLDEQSFFPRFTNDLANAQYSIFGLAPYFGQFRWPQIEPFFRAALQRGVSVTLIVPVIDENTLNKTYVENVINNLKALGAIIIYANGLHGKDVLIDQEVLYTGSMNWSSHRGRVEIIHRIHSATYAQKWLDYIQAKHIRSASLQEDETLRICPYCGCTTIIINQKKQRAWDRQPIKVGCSNPDCKKYLRNIDERLPFNNIPVCEIDGRTQYRRVVRGRRDVWECPVHPRERIKVVPGDPES